MNNNSNINNYNYNTNESNSNFNHLSQSKTIQRFNEEELTSTIYVDNLLNNINDWRNIQEIVRTSIKSLTEVVKAQGHAIKELEKQINGKATKVELVNGLGTKANINDVMRTFNEVASSIENRPTVDEVHGLLDEKVTKTDLQYLLNSKPSIDDVRNMITQKTDGLNFKEEIELDFKGRIDEIHNQINKKIQTLPSPKEIQNIYQQLDQKANVVEVNEALSNKISKETVLNALQRKMNKSEVDAIINSKVDVADFQNIVAAVKTKAEQIDFEKLNSFLETKADRTDLLQLNNYLNNKIDYKDHENLQNNLLELRTDTNKKLQDLDSDLDKLIDSVKKEFQGINTLINQMDQSKLEYKDYDKLMAAISKKMDPENANNNLNQLKNELNEKLQLIKNDNALMKKQIEDRINDKSHHLEKLNERLNEDFNNKFSRLNEEFIKLTNELPEVNNKLKSALQNQNKDFANDIGFLKDEILKLSGDIEDLYNIKSEKKDLDALQNNVYSSLDKSVSLNNLDNLYKSLMKELNDKSDENKNLINKSLKNFENDIYKLIDKKANQFDVTNALNSKADFGVTSVALQSKANSSDLDKIRNAVEKLIKDISSKIDLGKFDSFIKENKRLIEDLNRELLGKSSVKEVINMMKNKADIDDVNKALTQIHDELDLKSGVEQVSKFLILV